MALANLNVPLPTIGVQRGLAWLDVDQGDAVTDIAHCEPICCLTVDSDQCGLPVRGNGNAVQTNDYELRLRKKRLAHETLAGKTGRRGSRRRKMDRSEQGLQGIELARRASGNTENQATQADGGEADQASGQN